MDETPLQEDNTTDNIAAPQGPENAENTLEAGDQTNFSILLQTLTRFDIQDALTRGTNERLDSLTASQLFATTESTTSNEYREITRLAYDELCPTVNRHHSRATRIGRLPL